jgi:hypothetical protein
MMKKPNRWMETPLCGAARGQAGMIDAGLLAVLARASAVAIVDRYASDVRDREGLVEAIARVTLIGLDGHARLYAAERSIESLE